MRYLEEKLQAEEELSLYHTDVFPQGKIREPIPIILELESNDRIVYEQFRFSMKKLSRWMMLSVVIVMLLYFIVTMDAIIILELTFFPPSGSYQVAGSLLDPFPYWSAALGAAIISTGLFILQFLISKSKGNDSPKGHALGPKHRFEWLIDFGVGIVAIVLSMIYLLPQVGLDTWNSMAMELFWNRHNTVTPGYAPWAALVAASTFQVSIALVIAGLVLRVSSNAFGFLGRNEATALKWQIRSGLVLIVGVSLAIGTQILLTGGYYFGILSGVFVMAGLSLLLASMTFSNARLQELNWFESGGVGS